MIESNRHPNFFNMVDDDEPNGVYNREPIFKAKIILIGKWTCKVDKNLLCVITEGPFIPNGDDDIVKNPKDWNDNETKKALYYLKARNILISDLNAKVFYSILHHTSSKGMLDALQNLYEGTYDVNVSKINVFIEDFKLLCKEPGEYVDSM